MSPSELVRVREGKQEGKVAYRRREREKRKAWGWREGLPPFIS